MLSIAEGVEAGGGHSVHCRRDRSMRGMGMLGETRGVVAALEGVVGRTSDWDSSSM